MSNPKPFGVNELREMFLSFFESKGHLRLPSFSLIPQNDASLLLINSGMAPMKPWFTGEQEPPRRRVTTCQKCIRTGDIENIGKTARHGTYFEMLGNFSFGDYFKREAITWCWEFLTSPQWVGLDPNRLYPSIYEEDVTNQYFDTERRLEGYQTQYDRILALMDKAETVDELISIESELNRIYYQIESLTGSLQSWDARVNYSTVYYNLEEVRRASPVSLTLWERMQVSLQNTWDSIVLGSQNFVVWLYGALPALGLLLVLAGVAGLTVALCLRRRRRRAKAPKEEEPADGDKQKR